MPSSTRITARRRRCPSSRPPSRPFAQDGVVRPFEAGLPATVSAATGGVSIPPVWGPFLMRLVRELSPELCLELGTGVGISTAYQAAALDLNGAGRLITIDGSPEWAALAEQGLSALGLGRVQGEVGPIASTLPGALEDQPPVDYALVDAEHTEEATVGYFHSLLPYLSDGAVVVFDDIPWTSGMRRAWRAIARHPRVSGFALGRMGVAVMSTASG